MNTLAENNARESAERGMMADLREKNLRYCQSHAIIGFVATEREKQRWLDQENQERLNAEHLRLRRVARETGFGVKGGGK